MDDELQRIIRMLYHQNDVLGVARFKYLDMEAERKHFEATIISGLGGVSHAARTAAAQAMQPWLDFHKKLARLEAEYEFQKLKYEVLGKEFLAVHLTLKLDHDTIKKG